MVLVSAVNSKINQLHSFCSPPFSYQNHDGFALSDEFVNPNFARYSHWPTHKWVHAALIEGILMNQFDCRIMQILSKSLLGNSILCVLASNLMRKLLLLK